MISGRISRRVLVDRIAWVERMVSEIRSLPLGDQSAFLADTRNIWTAESCLRRGLEALLDLGRHILAKGFGLGVSEYEEIAQSLLERVVLQEEEAELLRLLAGYRNRLVHFYHEVSQEELYRICANQSGDLERILSAYRRWVREHPDQVDELL